MWKLVSSYLSPPQLSAPSLFRERENVNQDASDLLELTTLSKAANADTELHDVAPCSAASSLLEPRRASSNADMQDSLCSNEQLQQTSHSAGCVIKVSGATHWLQAPADQRLVLSVLLEFVNACDAKYLQQQVHRFMRCSGWQQACQDCRTAILVW
jgi:hypothetical protein